MKRYYTHVTRMLVGTALLGLVAWAQPVIAGIEIVGGVNSVQVTTDPANGNKAVVFGLTTGGALSVTPFAPDVVRVRYHWDGIWSKEDLAIAKPFGEWPSFSTTFQDEGTLYRIITPELEVEVVKSPNIQVHFKSKSGHYLSRDNRIEIDKQYDPVSDPSYINLRYSHALPNGFKLKNVREMPAGEAYFGFGEYAGPMNRRGHTIQMSNSDTFAWDEGWTPMYMSLPFFYGMQGDQPGRPSTAYGIFFNNPARPVFRMGTQWGDRYSFEAGDGQLDYFFFGGGSSHQMKNVLARYTELTGPPTMLPKWGLGYHMSRWSYNNQSWVEWLSQEFRNRDIPLDAIYLDIDYFDYNADDYYYDNSLHQLQFNYRFPNAGGMIQYAGARGVKIVPLIEAWLTQTDPKFGTAWSQFHFLKDYNYNQRITPIYFGNVSWLDFSSSPARNWWKWRLVDFLNSYPVAGIWNDLNEPADNGEIPLNAQYWLDGRYPNQWDSRKFHVNEKNLYAVRETQVTYDAMLQKSSSQRPFVLSRAGYPGIQRYALGWSGDNVASWNHCRHNIGLGVSVMISGQANFGHDVGGFVGSTSGELMTRWTEWASLNPLFRNHSMKWDAEREPWRFGSYFGDKMRDSIRFRYRLMPYLYTLAYQSTVSGQPMNTPTVMHFQHDPQTHWRNDNDFMVGSFLLASPVFSPGQNDRWTYLPNGSDWYNWYTGAKHAGGTWANQAAPLGTLPLYARAGAIIPMGPPMNHANQFQPNFLDLHVWPTPAGFSSEFTLHEDDGETWHFLAGAYARTRFVSARTADAFRFTIHARQGTYSTGSRHYYVKARDLDLPVSVSLNGANLPLDPTHGANACYSYDAAARMLVVKVPDTLQPTEIVASYTQQAAPLSWVGGTTFAPADGTIRSTDNIWVNTYTFPQQAATSASVILSTNQGAAWATNAMSRAGTQSHDDWWNRNLGAFPNGTKVWFYTRASDDQGNTLLDNNGGAYYRLTVGVLGPQIVWAGNPEHYPATGSIKPTDPVWVNVESWPKQAGVSAEVIVSLNEGQTWTTNSMSLAGARGNNDWWNRSLGTYTNGTRIWYWMRVTDGYGTTRVVDNGGAFFKTAVGTSPALQWAGNVDQYPANGSVTPTSDLWLNLETWPRQAATRTVTHVSTNGGTTWTTSVMNLAGARGSNDWWNRNLGKFTAGTQVRYWFETTDLYGKTLRVPATGHLSAQVN